MKIAMANVFFSPEQIGEFKHLAAEHGAGLVYFERGAELMREDLLEFDALMGYFPPEILPGPERLRWMQVPSAGVERLKARSTRKGRCSPTAPARLASRSRSI